ncbi:unnamed protein product, partial [Iphiclides podalirius]
MLCLAMDVTWPSPVLVMLKNETMTPLSHVVTDEESSWIVSVYFLSALFTLLLSFFFVNRLGKKQCLMFGSLPRIVSALICLFATNYQMLLIARVIKGISDTSAIVAVAPYAAEISSTEIRGSLGTISQVLSSLGVLIMFSVGPYVSYFTLNIIFTSIIVITFFPIFFLPESPYFLHSKGRSEDALAVLKFLRDSESTALTELNGYNVDKGINFDKRAFFREKTFIKTTLIGTVIALGTQLLGLGVFFTALKELKAESIHGFFNYLPLLSMGIVVLCFSSGAGPLYLLLIVELLDSPYRMVGTNVCMFASVMASFLLTKYFAAIITAIGSAATFYACSCNCLAFCVFVVIFVPETKNKSFGEIQSALANRVCHLKCSIKSTKM